MLQRLTEDLEYHRLLDGALQQRGGADVPGGAFSVSSYSTTVHRMAEALQPYAG